MKFQFEGEAAAGESVEVTDDAFLTDRLRILQPARGYRAGLDAVLLAACVRPTAVSASSNATRSRQVLDAGAGVGTVGLCVAVRCPDVQVTLVEMQKQLVSLAKKNVSRNDLAERVRVLQADVRSPERDLQTTGIERDFFELVLMNPPYLETGKGRSPPDPLKAGSHEMAAGDLDAWARFAARCAAPGGSIILIHRADSLVDVLDAFSDRFGALRVLPVYPRTGEPAHRIIVLGRKGSRAPLTILPPLVLHGDAGEFLPAIQSVLRDGAPVPGLPS